MHTLAQLRSGELAGVRRLDLSAGLTALPPEIFTLADSLEVLNLSGNALHSLPRDLHRLHRLKVLFCSDNPFSELPEAVGRCAQLELVGFKANRIERVSAAALPPRLRWLILTDNRIAELPAELGARPRLQKLMLAGNRLAALPPELAACRRLELLRIAANRFTELPAWLLAMPRLSWLACAGNPLRGTAAPAPAIGEVAWEALEMQRPPLGEGASGVIHPALLRRGHAVRVPGQVGAAVDGPRPVAVKLFKGAVTSDGSPASEMAACVAAGTHAHLVGALARLGGHPGGTPGLVMDRIAPAFRNLAGPPSLASCTRDVYPPETRFSPRGAWQLAQGIASAVAHLHARGILHGDLYAHNILWDGQGTALLGDFGAASFLPVGEASGSEGASLALQRMEVRAFGCLLDELLARVDASSGGASPAPTPDLAPMRALQRRCVDDTPTARPLFREIEAWLQAGLSGAAA